MASIVDDSTWTEFFWVSRNNITAHIERKALSGASFGMMPFPLWKYMYLNRKWTMCRWEALFMYSHDRRQTNRRIWMRLATHLAGGLGVADTDALIINPNRMAFLFLDGGSWKD